MSWAIGLFAITVAANTEIESPLTLEDVLSSTTRAYPLLAAAEQRRLVASADLLSAEGGFDPSWKTRANSFAPAYYPYYTIDSVIEQPTTLWGTNVFGGYRWGRGDVPPYYGNVETARGGELRAGVSVPLLRNGPIDRRRASIEQAKLGQKVADGDLALVRIDVLRAAAYRYWDWVMAGRRLAIAKELLGIAEARDEAVHRRSQAGDVAQIDKVDNERAIAERTERVVAFTRSLDQAAIALSLFVRDSQGEPVRPAPSRLPLSLPEPQHLHDAPLAGELERALSQRPEMLRLRAQRQQLELERTWAKNQKLPGLDVGVVASRDLGQGDPRFARTEVAANVMLDVPLQRRVATGREQAAMAGIERLRAEEQMAKDRIEAEVRDSLSALEAAWKRVGLARRQRGLAIQLEKAERTRFELGESNLLLVNLREQASADAALVEAEALGTWLRAKADYRAALADPH
ncbi:MAG: TolC family protein [Deltaproteobacteria bacterium]|nr:TolC family protein [Deltaproteobacteria bacterium]